MRNVDLSDRRCTAHRKSGERCRQYAIQGATVCRAHGGGAPQVKAAAVARLALLMDPAISVMAELMLQKRDKKVALGAAKDILDRNDLTGKVRVEQSGAVTLSVTRVIVEAPRQLEEGE